MSNERNWWFNEFMLESTDERTAAASISIRNCTDETIKIDIIPVARQGRDYDLTVTTAEIAPRHSIITEVRYSTQIASSHAKSKRPAPQTITTTPAEGATEAALKECMKFFSHDKCENRRRSWSGRQLNGLFCGAPFRFPDSGLVFQTFVRKNISETIYSSTSVIPMNISHSTDIVFQSTTSSQKSIDFLIKANANCQGEQGRVDDLWSMLYILAEMRGPLPWEQLRDIQEIAKLKKGTSDDKLLSKCPSKMLGIATHLRELDYHKRPDYAKLCQIMDGIMVEMEIKHSDLFDWEKQPNYSPSMTSEGKDAALQPENFDDKPPFAPVEFEKNDLGF